MHPTSEALFLAKGIPLFSDGQRVLEIGPDTIPSTYLNHLVRAQIDVDWYWAEFDVRPGYEQDSLRVACTEYSVDAPDDHYDVVFHGQVLEHVRAPWKFVPETARVLKPGGAMLVIMPAAWEHHACPVDCWRAYPEGLRALFEDAGLCVELAEWFLVDPTNNNGQADSIIIGRKP